MYENIELKHTLDEIVNLTDGNTLSLHGGRFISRVIAKDLDKNVDEIIIADTDHWVQNVSLNNLQEELNATIVPDKDDVPALKVFDFSIASSTMIPVKNNILKKVPKALIIV